MKKYLHFINEIKSSIDPFNEEEWEYEDEKDDKVPNNIYVIYVIGQDMNFLAKKKKVITDKRRGWYDHHYVIATVTKNDTVHFDGSATEKNPYSAEKVQDILAGKELVGHLVGNFGMMVKFSTLQSLCDKMEISIESVHMWNGHN